MKTKYLFIDGLLESSDNLTIFIRDEENPTGIIHEREKINIDSPFRSIEEALAYLKDEGFEAPSNEEVEDRIKEAVREGLDYINLKIVAMT